MDWADRRSPLPKRHPVAEQPESVSVVADGGAHRRRRVGMGAATLLAGAGAAPSAWSGGVAVFHRIVVLLDGSERAEWALPLALELARLAGGPVVLVRAASETIGVEPATDYLEAVRVRCAAVGVPVSAAVLPPSARLAALPPTSGDLLVTACAAAVPEGDAEAEADAGDEAARGALRVGVPVLLIPAAGPFDPRRNLPN
jgi:nucleotide-binding universal stress UspA family protein